MTPERAAELVGRWVRWYTRHLPAAIAQRRVGELDADLHDHIAHARSCGSADRRIVVSILSRMVRGLPADASWRWRVQPPKGALMKLRQVLVVLLAILAVVVGVAAMVHGEADDSPGLQLIGVLFIAGAVTFGVRTVQRGR